MAIIPWIIVTCWVVFILYWTVSAFGVKRDIGRTYWQHFWWVRIAALFIIIGWLWSTSSLGKISEHSGFFAQSMSGVLGAIAALFCVAGIGLAIWARIHLGRNWSPAPALKEGHELVTSGPYKVVRHPIYTGIMLAALGSALTIPVWLIVFFIITIMFVWRVHREERLMTQQFPNQYPEYKKRTWALIPFIW